MENLTTKLTIFAIISICALGITTRVYAGEKGCIAVFYNAKPVVIEVELPDFVGSRFQTQQFHFTNLPLNMQPNADGKYCYAPTDKRFLYVHTFYYAVKQIEFYNQFFTQLNYPLPKSLNWELVPDADGPTGGNTGLTDGQIEYSSYMPDPSVISHEIGHWLAFNTMQSNPKSLPKREGKIHFYRGLLQKLVSNKLDPMLFENTSVAESQAALLSSLYNGITREASVESFDLIEDNINNFVRIPDLLPTVRESLQATVDAPRFAAAYPKYVALIQEELKEGGDSLDVVMPYALGAVVDQPLWQAAHQFGNSTIITIYLQALHQLTDDQQLTYKKFVAALLNSANNNPTVSQFLSNEFTKRGLISGT